MKHYELHSQTALQKILKEQDFSQSNNIQKTESKTFPCAQKTSRLFHQFHRINVPLPLTEMTALSGSNLF